MISEWFEPQCPLARALYILDLSTQSAKQETEWRRREKNQRATNLFRSVGTQHDRVFRADEYFVLDAHSEAVKVLGELRIGRNVDTFSTAVTASASGR